MIPSIFSNLANALTGRDTDNDEVELSPEEQAAQDKADRITFHRTHVRNGPTTFKMLSAGQVRRAEARVKKREQDKIFKGQVRNYFEQQRVASFLRPHLQVVGLISFVGNGEAPLADQITSTAWIVQRYGRETTVDGVGTGHASFLRDDVLGALKTAAKFYGTATGLEVRVPADFEPAIYVDEDVA